VCVCDCSLIAIPLSTPTCTSHVTNMSRVISHIWIMSHKMSCHTFEWYMSRNPHVTNMSRVGRMNELRHTYESCHTHGWVMSRRPPRTSVLLVCRAPLMLHKWVMSHTWVLSHIWISHVTHMDESCHTVTN